MIGAVSCKNDNVILGALIQQPFLTPPLFIPVSFDPAEERHDKQISVLSPPLYLLYSGSPLNPQIWVLMVLLILWLAGQPITVAEDEREDYEDVKLLHSLCYCFLPACVQLAGGRIH